MAEDRDIIYHYCSVEAFFNIIKSGELWLSSVNETNDETEYSHYLNKFIEEINKKFNNKNGSEILHEIKKALNDIQIRPYIFCFSEAGDLLSQWRGYGDCGHGVAIGFSKKLLHLNSWPNTRNSIGIARVIYNINMQERKILDKINEITVFLLRHGLIFPEALPLTYAYEVKRESVIFKHNAFSEEKEVRIVFTPSYSDKDDKEPSGQNIDKQARRLEYDYRSSRGRVVKFYKFPYPRNSISEIVVGHNYNHGSIAALDEYLKDPKNDFGLDHVKVISSTCPYRD